LTALLVAIPLIGICSPTSDLLRNEINLAESGENFDAFRTSAGGAADNDGRRIPEATERGRTVCAGPSCVS
jgi:hypothetical protein